MEKGRRKTGEAVCGRATVIRTEGGGKIPADNEMVLEIPWEKKKKKLTLDLLLLLSRFAQRDIGSGRDRKPKGTDEYVVPQRVTGL